MTNTSKKMLDSNLEGQLLIAMPGMSDARFARSVVYICAHSDDGAMGLIINKHIAALTLGELLKDIKLRDDDGHALEFDALDDHEAAQQAVHMGGPVETSRGFVLHSRDYFADDVTVEITPGICLTATTDVLIAMASGKGPRQSLLALGYAGWSPGQLERELAANGWLNCPADPDLVFAANLETKYERALTKLGVDPSHLVSSTGRA